MVLDIAELRKDLKRYLRLAKENTSPNFAIVLEARKARMAAIIGEYIAQRHARKIREDFSQAVSMK